MIKFRGRNSGKSMASRIMIADTERYTSKIRWIHPYGFRAGEWATITGVFTAHPNGLEPRLCYHVVYKDGFQDSIPISDKANYELEVKTI